MPTWLLIVIVVAVHLALLHLALLGFLGRRHFSR